MFRNRLIQLEDESSESPRSLVLPLWLCVLIALGMVFFLESLDTYALFGIPFGWFASPLSLVVFAGLMGAARLPVIPGGGLFLLLTVWLVAVTVVNALTGDFMDIYPTGITSTPYTVFVTLRIMRVFAFFCILMITFYLVWVDRLDEAVHCIIIVGMIATIWGYYLYLAYIFGLPQPSRRLLPQYIGGLGTEYGGFAHSFIPRAFGGFLEPNVFAGWLMLPFCLSLGFRRSIINIYSIAIGGMVLLTVSLGAFLALGGGFILATLICNPIKARNIRRVLYITGIIALMIVVIDLVVPDEAGTQGGRYSEGMLGRIQLLTETGMGGSNRGYIVEYLRSEPFQIIGIGLAHVNIYFGNTVTPTGLVSLYVNLWFAGGIVALFLLALFLATPIILFFTSRIPSDGRIYYLVAAYFAWCIKVAVSHEEFQMMFAVTFALLVGEILRLRDSPVGRAR
jgi:hypothetical protein